MSEMQEQGRIPQIVEGAKDLLKDAKTYVALAGVAGVALIAPNVGSSEVDAHRVSSDNVPELDLSFDFPETTAKADETVNGTDEDESDETFAKDVTDEVDAGSVSDEELVAINADCDENGELIAEEVKDSEWVPEGPRWDSGVEGEDPEWVASQATDVEDTEDTEDTEEVEADGENLEADVPETEVEGDFCDVDEVVNEYEIEEVDFEKEKKETSAPVIKPEWLPAEEAPVAPAENVQNIGENGSDEKPKEPVIVTDPAEAFEGQPEGQTDAGESTTTTTEGGKGGVVEEPATQSEETEASEDGAEKETPTQDQTVAPVTTE